MKAGARRTSLQAQFPHLEAEPPIRPGWFRLGLAMGALAVVILVVAAIRTPERVALDFRRQAVPAGSAAQGFADIAWADLVPRGWDPSQQLRSIREAQGAMTDADPRARATLARMRDVLDAAPAEPALEGRAVQIPGYVVPLEGQRHGASEFLLVPYFGACIHSPPPPANQIIHVVMQQPAKDLRAMDVVRVRGVLSVARHQSGVATSGYRLAAVAVERHERATRRD